MSIASEISRLQTAKADLRTAIEGKGVTVPAAMPISGYHELVDAIQTGGAPYDGETEVDPRFSAVVLQTGGKSMGSNVTVNPIKILDVDNLAGGYTVTIGTN